MNPLLARLMDLRQQMAAIRRELEAMGPAIEAEMKRRSTTPSVPQSTPSSIPAPDGSISNRHRICDDYLFNQEAVSRLKCGKRRRSLRSTPFIER